jgi:hypothetical protein
MERWYLCLIKWIEKYKKKYWLKTKVGSWFKKKYIKCMHI